MNFEKVEVYDMLTIYNTLLDKNERKRYFLEKYIIKELNFKKNRKS